MTACIQIASLPIPAVWLPGPWEIVLILLVVLLLFGGKKLPELARGLARGLRSFKEEMRDVRSDIEGDGECDPSADHARKEDRPGSGDDPERH
jgi:sec-independent protein translocase protein TatA